MQQFDGENGRSGPFDIYMEKGKTLQQVLAGYVGNCLRACPSFFFQPTTAASMHSSVSKDLSASRCIFGMLG